MGQAVEFVAMVCYLPTVLGIWAHVFKAVRCYLVAPEAFDRATPVPHTTAAIAFGTILLGVPALAYGLLNAADHPIEAAYCLFYGIGAVAFVVTIKVTSKSGASKEAAPPESWSSPSDELRLDS